MKPPEQVVVLDLHGFSALFDERRSPFRKCGRKATANPSAQYIGSF
jgi:hypothetical protein